MTATLAIRPAQYAQAIELANDGALLREICEKIGVAVPTLTEWLAQDARFRALFAQAREAGLHLLADSLVKLPDEYQDVNKARLKSDNIKWLLARRLSRMYGDKLDVNLTGQVDLGSTLIEARKRTMQPISNQAETEYAQVIDAEAQPVAQPTDTESAESVRAHEPDIFS